MGMMRMKKQTSFKVEVIANIMVGNKVMQLSRRIGGKSVKVYLHYPLQRVTPANEISKDLCLMLLQNLK